MSLLQNELARWKNGQLELRPEPLRVRWTFDGLATSDGHGLRCTFTCSALGLADPTERRMLQEVLLQSRTSVTDNDLAAHFTRALKAAAEKVAEAQSVNQLLGDDGKRSLAEAMRTAGRPVAFACGVELVPPFQVDVESPTLQQQRQRAVQRSMAEQMTAQQIEHMQRSSELYKQFQDMRRAEPGASAGQTLELVNPADRGSMLQKLLLASASRAAGTTQLFAVAGPYLLRVDTADGSARADLTPLPPTLGPLRSVQAAEVDGRRVLLVGAQTGVLLVPTASPSDAVSYADPSLCSELGFSRVVYWARRRSIVGCHGDGGIVQWEIGTPSEPVTTVRPADLIGGGSSETNARPPGPRNLQVVDDERLMFSVGSRLAVWDGATTSFIDAGSSADVVSIVPAGEKIHVLHEDGTLCTLERISLDWACKERRGGRVKAAGALPWLGEVRLLLAGEDGQILCVGPDDSLVTHYASAHHGLRVVAGSADRVAAVSADRQRLIIWNSWDGRKPAAELFVAGVARHRVADIAFV
jgi:hypothetical protein